MVQRGSVVAEGGRAWLRGEVTTQEWFSAERRRARAEAQGRLEARLTRAQRPAAAR